MSSKTCTPLLDNGDNVEQCTPEPTATYDSTKRFKMPSPGRKRSASPSIENPNQSKQVDLGDNDARESLSDFDSQDDAWLCEAANAVEEKLIMKPTSDQVPSPTLAMKECWTCKQLLPPSAYYKSNIVKYYKCIDCEKKRLATYRQKVKDERHELALKVKQEIIMCLACKRPTPESQLARMGRFAQLICKPCYHKVKAHKKPHKAVLTEEGRCQKCMIYGPSNNCIKGCQ